MKVANSFLCLAALVQAVGAFKKLTPGPFFDRDEENATRMLMNTKPHTYAPAAPPVAPPAKGKGKGKGMEMSYKGKGKGMEMSAKGKGKGKGMEMSAKGKGKGKGMEMSAKGKGKGKGMEMSSKGKGKGKGKGATVSPPTLGDIVVESKDLTILEAALTASGLLPFFFDDEFEYTVLAPIDDAFAYFATVCPELFEVLLEDGWILHLIDILTMHVTEPALFSSNLTNAMELEMFNLEIVTVSVANGGVCFSPSVNGSACVLVPDVAASNGVAHVVDDVIKPFWIDFTVKDVAAALTPTLFELLECAGLADALDTFGITVFAPSDEALADLDADYLCGEGLPTLIEILTYHVVPKVIPSIIIPMGMTDLPTLQGSDVTVTYKPDDGVLMVNDANIIDVDWGVKNGFLHVIDGLLVPPAPAPGKGKGKGKGPAPAPSKGKGMAPSKGKGMMMMAPMGKGMSMAPKGKGKA